MVVSCFFEAVAVQLIFARCEFYLGKTYGFHVSGISMFMFLLLFEGPNFKSFLGRVFGRISVRFWEGFG